MCRTQRSGQRRLQRTLLTAYCSLLACVQQQESLHTPVSQRKQAPGAPPAAPRKTGMRLHSLSTSAPVRRLDFGEPQTQLWPSSEPQPSLHLSSPPPR